VNRESARPEPIALSSVRGVFVKTTRPSLSAGRGLIASVRGVAWFYPYPAWSLCETTARLPVFGNTSRNDVGRRSSDGDQEVEGHPSRAR
jgi:hypothetical protein